MGRAAPWRRATRGLAGNFQGCWGRQRRSDLDGPGDDAAFVTRGGVACQTGDPRADAATLSLDCCIAPNACHGATRCHRYFDAAYTDSHASADFEEGEAKSAACRVRIFRLLQSDAAQGAEENIGHGGKPQSQPIGPHRRGRSAIGIKIKLTLLDPVFHIAAGAIEFLVADPLDLHSRRVSEVTTKRGLASPSVNSALPTTRRRRVQPRRVWYMKLLKHRAGLPVRRLFLSARASSSAISAISLSFLANPNT